MRRRGRPAEPSRWVSCVSVDDVDRTVADAVAAGGRLVGTVAETPGVGRVARIVDPQGVELSLFRNTMGDPPDPVQVPEGRWLWNELHVPNPGAALDFYGRVLGYQHRTFGPGGAEPYVILSRDGVDRGGVTSAGCREVPPHWLPYVHVQDVDRAVDAGTERRRSGADGRGHSRRGPDRRPRRPRRSGAGVPLAVAPHLGGRARAIRANRIRPRRRAPTRQA